MKSEEWIQPWTVLSQSYLYCDEERGGGGGEEEEDDGDDDDDDGDDGDDDDGDDELIALCLVKTMANSRSYTVSQVQRNSHKTFNTMNMCLCMHLVMTTLKH